MKKGRHKKDYHIILLVRVVTFLKKSQNQTYFYYVVCVCVRFECWGGVRFEFAIMCVCVCV